MQEVSTREVGEAWGVSIQRVHERMGQCGYTGRKVGPARVWPGEAVEAARPAGRGSNQFQTVAGRKSKPRKSR